MKNDTKKLGNVVFITLFRNVRLNFQNDNKLHSFLIISDDDKDIDLKIVLDIETGEEYSIDNLGELGMIYNKSTVEVLYLNNGLEFQEDMNINSIKEVVLYKNRKLINTYTNKIISSKYILKISDINNISIYVDIMNNRIYKRSNNYCLEENKNYKSVLLFKNGYKTILPKNLFNKLEAIINKFKIEKISVNDYLDGTYMVK